MLDAILTRNWKAAILILGVAALLLLWHFDRRGQYLLGVSDAKQSIAEAITKSKELTAHEKNSAINSASAAARSVCNEAGEDPRLCDDL